MRTALGDAYAQTDRRNPQPFVALPKEQWNDAVNNYRMRLGDYDCRRMLFAKKFLYGRREFNEMFKFVIVRNPYDRAVSTWLYLTGRSTGWNILRMISKKRALKLFLEKLPEVWRRKADRHLATHTQPVVPDITDEQGSVLVDHIGKLEEIQTEFDHICKQTGLPTRRFPVVNSSGRTDGYRAYFTPASRKLIQTYYGADLELFGYCF